MGWWFGSAERERERLAADLARQAQENALLRARLEKLERPSTPEEVLRETIVPFGSQAALGSTLGYTSGYALRVAGRVAGAAIGTGFIFVQCLSYMGYLSVDWRKVERDYLKSLDRDGDGEITVNDLSLVWTEIADVLAFNLPAGTGFAGGLLYGLNFASVTKAGAPSWRSAAPTSHNNARAYSTYYFCHVLSWPKRSGDNIPRDLDESNASSPRNKNHHHLGENNKVVRLISEPRGGLAAVGGLGARFLLPRVALGAGAATATPAFLIAAKRTLGFNDDDDGGAPKPPAA